METLNCPVCGDPYTRGDLICFTCGANLARAGTRRQPPTQPAQPGPPAEQRGPEPPAQDPWAPHQHPPQQPPPQQRPPQPGPPAEDPWARQPAPPHRPEPGQEPWQQQRPPQPEQRGPEPGQEPWQQQPQQQQRPPEQRGPGPAGQEPWGPQQPPSRQEPWEPAQQRPPGPGGGHAPLSPTPPHGPAGRPPGPPPARREETLIPPEERGPRRPQPPVDENTAFMCPHCEAVLRNPGAAQCDACLRPLRQQPPALRLVFPTGEIKVSVGQHVVLGRDVGQSPVATTFTQYDNVSRRHSTVWLDPSGTAWVRDEGSTNGTFVNGERLPPRVEAPLADGDSLRLAADVTGTVHVS
ncbi:hypothetical protein DPM19_15720 [Actinomadura craniellae]|uniref:FHA domain-containing protein n=1 Tax=Actinomadura craniellae TaxID=2231787 RepID=A0A365H5M1_9ACTN|nr:FHA domain-containing protein [Actinomadura craniellae]RAY14404.1 hypothetical protein DPM19_15720 [Actinomadura craniellae]